MRGCTQRGRLIIESHQAGLRFADSVGKLKASIGDRKFANQRQPTELPRHDAETARHDAGITPGPARLLSCIERRNPLV
jgi:hypothetical protein